MIFSLLKIHTQHSKKPSPKGGGFLFAFFFPTNRLGGIAARHAAASQRGYSLSEENTPFESPRERRGESPSTPALAVGRLKSCAACGIRCLPSVAARRFGLLLLPAAALPAIRQPYAISAYFGFYQPCKCLPGRGIAALAALLGYEKNDRVNGRFYS